MTESDREEAISANLHEMQRLAEQLRKLIQSQPPKELIGYIYGQLLLASPEMYDAQPSAENEYRTQYKLTVEDIQFLLEYVHAAIASSQNKIGTEDFSENIIKEIFDISGALKQLALLHCIFTSSATDGFFGPKTGEVEHRAKSNWVMLRGNRYQVLEEEFYSFVLEPHDAVLKEIYGVGAKEIAAGFQSMADAVRTGHMNAVDFIERQMEAAYALANAHGSTFEEAMGKWAQEKPEEHQMSRSAIDDLLRGGVCNVSRHTTLPQSLLDDLSFNPGEEADFFAEGIYCGTPFRTLPARKKPLIKLDGESYAIDLCFPRDAGYRALLYNLLGRKAEYKRDFEERQKDMSEKAFAKIFHNQLAGAKIYQGVWHRDISTRQWVECDALILLDDVMIVIEAKAGAAATIASPTLDFDRHIQSIQELIIKAYAQCQRFLSYLDAAPEVPIYQRLSGKYVEVDRIELGKYRSVFPIGLTVESFSPFSAMCKELPGITPLLGRYPFMSISIDDLLVLNRFLPTAGQLMHYLEVRQNVAGITGALLYDEIDHLGAYITQNRFDLTLIEQMRDGKANLVIWDGMSDVVDRCFEGHDWQLRPLASQSCPDEVLGLLGALDKTRAKGWLASDSHIRSYDDEGRNNLATMLATCRGSLDTRPSRYFQIFGEQSLFVWLQRNNVSVNMDTVSMKAAAAALATNATDTIAILALVYPNGEYAQANRFWFEVPKDRTPETEAVFVDADRMRTRQVPISSMNQPSSAMVKKLGRNKPCWCGSGMKFKKCHGR